MTRGCVCSAEVARGEVCSLTGVAGWASDTAAVGMVRPGIINPPCKIYGTVILIVVYL